MIKLDGQIIIKTINGRNGPFNVGKLQTDLGEFSAKSIRIEELAEGKYSGSFLISRIYPGSYCVGGRVIAEIRIDINEMFLRDHDEKPLPTATAFQAEVDPLDEEPVMPVSMRVRPRAQVEPQQAESESAEELMGTALFGLLWPLGRVVALDSTVDRSRLREQTHYLKQHGYRFDFKNKVWNREEHPNQDHHGSH